MVEERSIVRSDLDQARAELAGSRFISGRALAKAPYSLGSDTLRRLAEVAKTDALRAVHLSINGTTSWYYHVDDLGALRVHSAFDKTVRAKLQQIPRHFTAQQNR